ncbi:MAG: hypothetical protein JWM98_2706 [Thermoleophilia bacterium]|nr:hypothetical protein [Thermoleophilia bacterium]
MQDPVPPDEFQNRLRQELASASEQEAMGLHVQVTVPPDSAYGWHSEEGDVFEVHLPTRLKVAPMMMLGEPHEDGGPAAVFRIDANGLLPAEPVVEMLADELYRECIRWGRVHHVRSDAPQRDLPGLPPEFEQLVADSING